MLCKRALSVLVACSSSKMKQIQVIADMAFWRTKSTHKRYIPKSSPQQFTHALSDH